MTPEELLVAPTDDPWFAAVQRLFSDPVWAEPAGDPELFQRLQDAAATGPYEQLAVHVSDHVADAGPRPVRVRVYQPVGNGVDRRLLVFCHGGAWLGGDLDMPEADATAREVCHRSDSVVVSVDYRRALLGVHYPVPLEDVETAYRWATANASALGASPSKVALGGASAGANLAAGCCLRLRDANESPAALLLVYPVVHAVLPPPSDELARKIAVLSPGAAFAPPVFGPMVENYLGAPAADAAADAMPGQAAVDGFPPTLIINCEYDGLRASGEAFADRLRSSGVDVEVVLALDVLHGHINSPWLAQAQQSYADIADWLTRRLP